MARREGFFGGAQERVYKVHQALVYEIRDNEGKKSLRLGKRKVSCSTWGGRLLAKQSKMRVSKKY